MIVPLVGGCDSIGQLLEPPGMEKPVGVQTPIAPQETPELEARAAKEREDLPAVPTPPDPETYSNLGTVPKKPVMPTEAEIKGQVDALAAEQQAGDALIASQANAPEPQTLPKAETKPVTEEQGFSASQDQVFTGNANPFLPQSQIEQTDRLPANAP